MTGRPAWPTGGGEAPAARRGCSRQLPLPRPA